MKKNIGLCSVTFRKKSAAEIIELTRKEGLSCIEWGGDIHAPTGDIRNAEYAGKLTRKNGLECDSYGSYYRCDDTADFLSVSETAYALGSGTIRIWAGRRDSALFSKDEFEALVQNVKRCADIAKTKNQIIAFEYHYGTYCDNAESVLRLISSVGKDNVKTYWQPMYWKESPSEAERIDNNLKSLDILGKAVENIHVYQWRGKEKLPLINGADEWKLYFEHSNAINYYMEFVKDDSEAQFSSDCEIIKGFTRS